MQWNISSLTRTATSDVESHRDDKKFQFPFFPQPSHSKQVSTTPTWRGSYDKLDDIKVPALVLVGDKDDSTPKGNSEFIRKKIPDSKLIVIKGGGHGVMYQVNK